MCQMFLHLKLQHGFSFVGLEHEAKRSDSCVGVIRLLSVSL